VESGRGAVFKSKERLLKAIPEFRKTDNTDPVLPIPDDLTVAKDDTIPFLMYKITPKTSSTTDDIVYFHSGGYVLQADPRHWRFVYKLALATGATIFFAIYPLAPDFGPKDSYVPLLNWWKKLNRPMTVAGDSAGAGMAIHLSQDIKKAGLTPPSNMILLSPYLSCSTKEAPDGDPILSAADVGNAGELWSREETNVLDRDVTNLVTGKTLVCAGTCDCLVWQAREFAEKVPHAEYIEEKGLVHIWHLLPVPEAEGVIKKIVETICK